MFDSHGRQITYLRVSVTDRCDLRCSYCAVPGRVLLERRHILSLEEITRICGVFADLGVRKIRITGGEPLVRRGVLTLFQNLAGLNRLDEVTLTTNGTQLGSFADGLVKAGVRRVNVSLDTLDAARFKAIAGRDVLEQVLNGIAVARQAGLSVKINMVVMTDTTDGEIDSLIRWCGMGGLDLTLIEVMPMGPAKLPVLSKHLALRDRLERRWRLTPLCERTGGPARYVRVNETGGRLGFITPMSANFCEGCNRVRLTSDGILKLCLDRGDSINLRSLLQAGATDEDLKQVILSAVEGKPKGHDFTREPSKVSPQRSMSAIGG
ncbi:MAG: GTP 3',8-cyclase MoaA [Alphaproteobacteria bacterium]|nr:GTP 3',8-cyclase MoaA [Alphaproteobacteria bacterium]